MNINPKYLSRILVQTTIFLVLLGLIFLISAVSSEVATNSNISIWRVTLSQVFLGLGGGVVVFYILSHLKNTYYRDYHWIIFAFAVFLMLLLFTPVGIEVNNAIRWLDVFGLSTFQPSEFLKFATILSIASILSKKDFQQNKIYILSVITFIIIVIFFFARYQPDYGLFLIIFISILAMAFAALPTRWFIGLLALGGGLMAFIVTFTDYVQNRLLITWKIIFDKEALTMSEKLGIAFQSLQNIEVIEAGGLFGIGLGEGLQKFESVPELTTDSIFVLVAGETGFLFTILIVVAFLAFISCGYLIARYARDRFSFYLAIGITTLFSAQILINLFVALGFVITGVPLLFFSKGGTSLLITLAMVGVLNYIATHRLSNRENL